MKYSLIIKKIDKICWITIITVMCYIAVLKPFSILSNIALLSFYLIHIFINKTYKKLDFKILTIFVILFSGYSLLMEQSISGVFRFSMILFFLFLSPLISFNMKNIIRIIYYCSFPFVIIIILLELYLLFLADAVTISSLRLYIINNGMGDVFTLDKIYRIQLSGTGCLLAFYLLSFVTDLFPPKRKKILRYIYLLSIILAGNFSFILGLFIFFLLYILFTKWEKHKFINATIILFLLMPFIIPESIKYIQKQIEQKSEVSNRERIDQTNVLISDLSENFLTLLFGKGLGNKVQKKGIFRDYSKSGDYYELQSLYFLNQMGLIYFTFFIFFNIWVMIKIIKNKKANIVYISYISYTFFNPYMLNTLHVIVLLILCNLSHSKSTKLNNIYYEKNKITFT